VAPELADIVVQAVGPDFGLIFRPISSSRLRGKMIVPEAFAAPVYLTDQMQILEAEGPRYGRYCALSPSPS